MSRHQLLQISSQRGEWMRFSVLAAVLLLATSSSSPAQLAIENPGHLQMPEQKANLLLNTACRVVVEKFRISHPPDHLLLLKLVLGSKDEHYTADEDKGSYALFLERWDETKFTVAVTNLAIQQFVIHDRVASIVNEVLRRTARVAPVPVAQLRGSKVPVQPLAGQTSNCMSAITQAAVRKIPCGPLPAPSPQTD